MTIKNTITGPQSSSSLSLFGNNGNIGKKTPAFSHYTPLTFCTILGNNGNIGSETPKKA